MTTGALIFAFNNEQTDYVAMASWSADNIRRHLDIPVGVVTDCNDDNKLKGFDVVVPANAAHGGSRYFSDYDATVTWNNAGRTDAYALTPWDNTLVLDADYVVASNALKRIVEADTDFMCHRLAVDLTTGYPLDGLNTFGRYKLPMWWATVMMFRRSNTAQYIFDCMNMVRNNWQHYRDLYGIDKSTYRNDFALSIALGIVSGHTGIVDEIPWNLMSALPEVAVQRYNGSNADYYKFDYKDSQGAAKTVALAGLDFHAMGKLHLENIIATH